MLQKENKSYFLFFVVVSKTNIDASNRTFRLFIAHRFFLCIEKWIHF